MSKNSKCFPPLLAKLAAALPRLLRPFWLAGLLAASACSPALNWRSVALCELSVTLPCKPDRGERTVLLGTQSVRMEMVGCEADGALFAVSRVRVPQGMAPERMQVQWQSATLQQMRARLDPAQPSKIGGTTRLPLTVVTATGQRTDGQPLQANLAWVAVGTDLVHLAVYAEHLTQEHSEPFLEGIRAP